MTDNIYHKMYVEAVHANRELGGKDADVPLPFALTALESFHFQVLNELKVFRAKAKEAEALVTGRAHKATVKNAPLHVVEETHAPEGE